ncbi:transporter [Marivivens niveibacter]|uniref:Transporter n=1 Tax=Marivivens niveibacter TaxID=1930667 RepID=A0A251X1U5_9RHOB|nr:TolC family outer membrane protein [Marivivens niveibacter]OUD10541.1 transporter [Marivivens niveibacter]
MFRKSIVAATAVIALVTTTSAAWSETLGDALVSAYNSSGLLDQNRAVLRAADEDVASAVAALRPTLSYSASASINDATEVWSETYALVAGLTLYDGGANRMAVDAAKEAVLGTRQELLSAEQDVLLTAIQAYLDVQTAREFVNLRQSNVRVLTQELRAARDRFDVGEVTRTDVSLAEAELASARSLLAVAQGNLITAEESYRVAVGHAPGSLATAPNANIGMSVAQARDFAVRNHPAIRSLQHSIAAAELAIQIAESAAGPSVSAQAQMGAGRSDFSEFSVARQFSLSMSGPIYAGGAQSSAVRSAQATRDRLRAALHVATLSVEQAVTSAFASYQAAVAASEAYRQGVTASQLAFDGVREEANAGSRTTIDVLNAEQTLLDARANLVDARAAVVEATYGILYAVGLLNVDHLDLPVQTYDVIGHYNMVESAPIRISPQGQAIERVLEAIR